VRHTAAMSPGRIVSLNTARARRIDAGGHSFVSAIGKRPVAEAVRVHTLGLDGDERADPSLHGGLSKALYAYPHEHYPFWQTVRAQARVALWDEPLACGMLGENLTIEGLLETQAWIGDRLRFADCELAVSGPRLPCFKLNAAIGFAQAARLMVQSGYCGFYLAVVRPGTLRAGETFDLLPGPREVSVSELFRARAARSDV
jgi:MOSC domain-containing protein YiiM